MVLDSVLGLGLELDLGLGLALDLDSVPDLDLALDSDSALVPDLGLALGLALGTVLGAELKPVRTRPAGRRPRATRWALVRRATDPGASRRRLLAAPMQAATTLAALLPAVL